MPHQGQTPFQEQYADQNYDYNDPQPAPYQQPAPRPLFFFLLHLSA
jgi:hypothetical protein